MIFAVTTVTFHQIRAVTCDRGIVYSTLWSYVYVRVCTLNVIILSCAAFVSLTRERNRFQVQESKTILRKRT